MSEKRGTHSLPPERSKSTSHESRGDTCGSPLTRRDFMRAISCAALAAALPLESCADDGEQPQEGEKPRDRSQGKPSKVVLVRDKDALDEEGRPVPEVIQRMLDDAVNELFGTENPVDAWKTLVKPSDIVGIKSNVWTPLSTPTELLETIKTRMVDAGVEEKNIRIDDRGARRTLAGSTALINARPLRTHHWAGIGGCIKNMIMFVESPPDYHPDMCASLAAIWELPIIKGKTRLNILVVLTPQFYTRGPHHFDSTYVWEYKGLLVSQDPVAVDAVGVRILEAKRKLHFEEDRPLAHLAKHVRIAEEKHGLGVSDMSRIELVKLGWMEDVLV